MKERKPFLRKTRLVYNRVGDCAYVTAGKHTVVVDLEDVPLLAGWTISVSTCRYVRLLGSFSEKPQKCVYLHRMILNAPADMDVDHISGDRLDNRKINLRVCNSAENARNRKCSDSVRRVFKGCHYYKNQRGNKKWIARIWINGANLFLGCFMTPEEAAAAYNDRAKSEFGPFARLNTLDTPRATYSAVGL